MDMFAAQNHGGMSGMMFIDIMTMPGMGPLRGSADFSFRDESMDARNAFTPEKAPEQLQQYGFNLSGHDQAQQDVVLAERRGRVPVHVAEPVRRGAGRHHLHRHPAAAAPRQLQT